MPSLCIQVAAVGLLLLLLFAGNANASSRQTGAVPIRGDEDLELNCPSIDYHWPIGTIRCETCKAIARLAEHRVFNKRMMSEEAVDGDEMCPQLMEDAELKQRKNGKRFVHIHGVDKPLPKKGPDGKDLEKVDLTFHTVKERKTLPCYNYFLKQRCYQMIGDHEEKLVHALNFGERYFRSLNNKNNKKHAEDGSSDDMSFDEVRKEQWERLARFCSHTDDCPEEGVHGHRDFEAAEKEERIRFMKYEGRYGNDKFRYVEDEDTPGLLVRNPYAKGGVMESDNELLHGHDGSSEEGDEL